MSTTPTLRDAAQALSDLRETYEGMTGDSHPGNQHWRRAFTEAHRALRAALTQGAGEALVDKSPDLQGSLVDKTANLQGQAGEAVEPVGYVNPHSLEWLASPDRSPRARSTTEICKTADEFSTEPIFTATQLQQAVARALAPIQQAIRDYHYALDTRQHGGVAQSKAFEEICKHLGMHWQQGKEAEARAKGTHD